MALVNHGEVTRATTPRGSPTPPAPRYGVVVATIVAFALTFYNIVRFPHSADGDTPAALVLIGLELALYAVAALQLTRAGARGTTACGLGAGGLWVANGLFTSLTQLGAVAYQVVAWSTVLGAFALCIVAGLMVVRQSGRPADGLGAGAWVALIALPLAVISMHLVTLTFTDLVLRLNLTDPGYLRSSMRDVAAWTVQDNLGGCLILLLLGPLCAVPLGGIGGLLWKGRGLLRAV